jgi:large repetitive protein
MLLGIAIGIPDASANTSSSHPFILEWGESGISKSGHFSFPQNLAVDEIGNVYVTDLGNKRVQKFNNDGIFLAAWGSSGSGSGQFHHPAGIVEFNQTVFVVDNQLHRIQSFDLEGNFINKWGEEGSAPGQFLLPNGIAVGDNGTIYVVDTGNQRIQKFTQSGEYVSEFGESGTEDGKFVTPIGITVDNQENVYVTDPGKNKIFKYDSEGVFKQSYGPNFAGFALMPQGLVIDPSGNIYVTDTTHDRILLVSQAGSTLSTWGSMGISNGQFKQPKDIALDKNGHLFVVDSNGHRIQKFGSPLVQGIAETESSSSNETPQPAQENVSLAPANPVPGDLTKPVITPPNDLFIEAVSGLTPVSVGQAMATDQSGIQSLSSNAPAQFPLGTTTISGLQ